MSNLTVSHYDHATGNFVTRNMNAEELAVYEIMQAEAEAEAAALAAKAIARQALLEKLGITEEEAQLLLGGV